MWLESGKSPIKSGWWYDPLGLRNSAKAIRHKLLGQISFLPMQTCVTSVLLHNWVGCILLRVHAFTELFNSKCKMSNTIPKVYIGSCVLWFDLCQKNHYHQIVTGSLAAASSPRSVLPVYQILSHIIMFKMNIWI